MKQSLPSDKKERSDDTIFAIWKHQPSAFYSFLRSLFLFSFLFALVLLIDYFLPRKVFEEVIIEWSANAEDHSFAKGDPRIEKLNALVPVEFRVRTKSTHTALSIEDAQKIDAGDTLRIEQTPLFSTTTALRTKKSQDSLVPYMNMYGVLLFIPLGLIMLSLAGLFIPIKEDRLYAVAVADLLLLAGFIVMRFLYF